MALRERADLQVARRIARRVRERDGGLPHVKALGVPLNDRGIVQVSMNLTNYEKTSLSQAFDAVMREVGAVSVGSVVIAADTTVEIDGETYKVFEIESDAGGGMKLALRIR